MQSVQTNVFLGNCDQWKTIDVVFGGRWWARAFPLVQQLHIKYMRITECD